MSSVGNRSYEFAIVTSLTSDVRAGAAERARAERVRASLDKPPRASVEAASCDETIWTGYSRRTRTMR